MKDIKEKPTERVPRSNTRGNIPKAALKKAWTEAKEKSRNKLRESTSTREDDNYTAAPDTGVVLTDTSRLASSKTQISPCSRGASLPANR